MKNPERVKAGMVAFLNHQSQQHTCRISPVPHPKPISHTSLITPLRHKAYPQYQFETISWYIFSYSEPIEVRRSLQQSHNSDVVASLIPKDLLRSKDLILMNVLLFLNFASALDSVS
ncbi:hypothetical protein QE152_g24479 [Popillia japonica]|uniref:Uncharacterized protein n=1 Tax=Popillia japonica TaxID=7064 RepID=A0AAW1KF96_POPJA